MKSMGLKLRTDYGDLHVHRAKSRLTCFGRVKPCCQAHCGDPISLQVSAGEMLTPAVHPFPSVSLVLILDISMSNFAEEGFCCTAECLGNGS